MEDVCYDFVRSTLSQCQTENHASTGAHETCLIFEMPRCVLYSYILVLPIVVETINKGSKAGVRACVSACLTFEEQRTKSTLVMHYYKS